MGVNGIENPKMGLDLLDCTIVEIRAVFFYYHQACVFIKKVLLYLPLLKPLLDDADRSY